MCVCVCVCKEAERQLNNTENYKKIQEDPTATNMKLVNDTIGRFKNQKLINQKVAEGLKRNDPKTPKFYLRPKIHKEGNLGRPVASSVNCYTENISKYVDYHLQPIVTSATKPFFVIKYPLMCN